MFPGLSAEVTGRYSLTFVTERSDPALDKRLGHRIGVVVNRRALEAAESWNAYARNPIGTGPYRIAEYRADQHLILEAFDDYWGGRPPLRRIRFLEVPEVAAEPVDPPRLQGRGLLVVTALVEEVAQVKPVRMDIPVSELALVGQE